MCYNVDGGRGLTYTPGRFQLTYKKEDLSSSLSADLVHSAFVGQVIRLAGDPYACGYAQDQCDDPED